MVASAVAVMAIEETGGKLVDFQPIIDALTKAVTPEQLLAVLAAVIGAGMGFVLMWFGVRKLVRIFSNALQKGKISV